MKVLYIYSGKRKGRFNGQIGIDYPDTQFYGLNHLSEFGIEAEYKEPLVFLRKILGFRLSHALMFFSSRNYDIVFGSSLLYFLFWKKLFRARSKYILLNIGLNRTISINKNKKIKSKIINWLLKELYGIVCLSKFQKHHLEDIAPFLKDKTYFIPLGVDVSYYKPKFKNRGDFILSVGRDNGRDYKTVIETASLMPGQEFHIVCSKRNLEGISVIPKNVRIFYDLPLSELHKKYQEAGLLLLITHDDFFHDGADCSGQTVLLDAMANGLPVVVSRKKYLMDYVVNKKEVIFVDFYDSVKVKIAIESLLDNAEFKNDIAVRARGLVEREFSTRKMAKSLSDIFLSLS